MYFGEFLSVLAQLESLQPGNVKAYRWIRTSIAEFPDVPRIQMVVLLDDVASVDAAVAIVSAAFDDVVALEFIVTASEDAFMSIISVNPSHSSNPDNLLSEPYM
jgi:hypothetical protein